jgi:hypothetical protein
MTSLRMFRFACTRALASPALVLLLYAANVLLAFPALYFSRAVLTRALGTSLAGESFLAGFDFSTWVDLLASQNLSPGLLSAIAIPLGVLSIVVSTFLAGGVLNILAHEKRFSLPSFFQACGMYVGRFFRLWILTACVLFCAVVLFAGIGGTILGMTSAQADSERTTALVFVASVLVFSIPVLFLFMASDYARVSTVVQDGHSSWKAFGRGLLFVLRNWSSALGLHLLLLLLLAAAVALYLLLEGTLTVDGPFTVVFLFLLQQLFMLLRSVLRVAFSAGEVALFEERKPRPVVFYGWDDSPPHRDV